METSETAGAPTEGKEGEHYFRPNRCVKHILVPLGPGLVPRDEICPEGKLTHLMEEFESHSDLQGKTIMRRYDWSSRLYIKECGAWH